MHYAVSDIHGCYNQFIKLMDMIGFSDTDTLYVRFDENFEFFEKVGVVTISAEGCEPCTITITQGEAVPYLILDDEHSELFELLAEILDIKTDYTVIKSDIGLMIEYLERSVYIDFKRSRNTVRLRLRLLFKYVI